MSEYQALAAGAPITRGIPVMRPGSDLEILDIVMVLVQRAPDSGQVFLRARF